MEQLSLMSKLFLFPSHFIKKPSRLLDQARLRMRFTDTEN